MAQLKTPGFRAPLKNGPAVGNGGPFFQGALNEEGGFRRPFNFN